MSFFSGLGSQTNAAIAGQPHGGGTQVAPTDVIGPIMQKWQTDVQNAQLATKAKQALMGSVFGLAGSGLGAWGLQGFPLTGTKIGKLLGMNTPPPTGSLPTTGSPAQYSLGGSVAPDSGSSTEGGGGLMDLMGGSDGEDALSLLSGAQPTDLGAGMAGGVAPDLAAFGGDAALGLGADAGLGLGADALGMGAGALAAGGLAEAGGVGMADLLPLLLLA